MQRNGFRLSAVLAVMIWQLGFASFQVEAEERATAARASRALALAPDDLEPKNGEHPLQPIIRWARAGLVDMQRIDDYSCTLVKRELIDGKLVGPTWYALKVRHEPFSVYLRNEGRRGPRGEEAIYVDGRNDGKMWAHSDTYRTLGSVAFFPDSRQAMRESRYPITDIGVVKLVERLVEVAEHDAQFGECEVKFYPDTKVDARPTLCVAVTHPVPRKEFTFHHARIYVDREWNIPIRYEAYSWPAKKGDRPPLLEEYTYLKLEVDRGYSDTDFDMTNPAYRFPPVSPDRAEPADAAARNAPAASRAADGDALAVD